MAGPPMAEAELGDGADLNDEARRYRKETAAERPDDARLKALAGQ